VGWEGLRERKNGSSSSEGEGAGVELGGGGDEGCGPGFEGLAGLGVAACEGSEGAVSAMLSMRWCDFGCSDNNIVERLYLGIGDENRC